MNESGRERAVYVCNCNGIREREVRAAIEQGARRPADVFRHCQSRPQCAKCVCDVRRMIDKQRELMPIAGDQEATCRATAISSGS